jgi:competence protein ComGC
MKVKYSAQCLRPLIFENWNKGLTTLELLIILLGITILGAIILPIIFRSQEAKAKKQRYNKRLKLLLMR